MKRQVLTYPHILHTQEVTGCESILSPSEERRPAGLLEDDGVLVTGGDILETFDRLEVLESAAEAIVNCLTVRTLAPMPNAVTREVDRVLLAE